MNDSNQDNLSKLSDQQKDAGGTESSDQPQIDENQTEQNLPEQNNKQDMQQSENLPKEDVEQEDEIAALLKRFGSSASKEEKTDNSEKVENPDVAQEGKVYNADSDENPEIGIGRKKEQFILNLENDKDYQKIRSYHKVEHKKQHRFLRFLLHLLIALCIMAAAGGLGYVVLEGITDILGIHQKDHEIIVEVPKGASLNDISQLLEEKGVILSSDLFKAFDKYADLTGEYQFGTFVLNTNMSYEQIMMELKQYNIAKEIVRVTFPEGSSLLDMAKLLEEKGVCEEDAFLDAINNTNFKYSFINKISDDEMKYFKMEGYAFPDTYDFYQDDNPVSVAQKLLYNLEKKFDADMYTRLDELGISFEDFMTLASIVQAESKTEEQMKNIASVYWNRLNNSAEYPKLQADPTRVYGREIKSDMQIINKELIAAYDTYESEGLPPGPICSPGLQAIMATLYPAETDYYYFCSNLKTGECFYASNLKDHNKNLRACGLL